MTFPMPTDTAHVRLRTRMYRFITIDLGEGVETSTLKVAATFTLPWVALCFLVGVPLLSVPYVYILPPLFLTFRACTRDAGGRVRLRGWVDRLDARRSQQPIVNGGTEPATRPAPISLNVSFAVLDEAPTPRRTWKERRRAEAA